VIEVLPSLIDEFGALDAELEALKPKKERHEYLRKQILSWYEDEPVDQAFAPEGNLYVVAITERASERSYKPTAMRRLSKYLGGAFYSLCSLTLKNFDANVPEGDRHRFVDQAQTGARRLKAIAKSKKPSEVIPIRELPKAA